MKCKEEIAYFCKFVFVALINSRLQRTRSVLYHHARCHISHRVSQAETEILLDSCRTDRTPLKFLSRSKSRTNHCKATQCKVV